MKKKTLLNFWLLLCLFMAGAISAWADDVYEVYTENEIVAGDYVIAYDGGAMTASVTSNRFGVTTLSYYMEDGNVVNPNASFIWRLVVDNEGYVLIYNEYHERYAAGTGTKNQGQLIDAGASTLAQWTATQNNGTWEFVCRDNADKKINSNLRRNGDYGFACYATTTGGSLTLYKKVEEVIDPSDTRTAIKITFDDGELTNNIALGDCLGSLRAVVTDAEDNDIFGTYDELAFWWSCEGEAGYMKELEEGEGIKGLNQAVYSDNAGHAVFTIHFEGDENYKPATATYEFDVINKNYYAVTWSVNGETTVVPGVLVDDPIEFPDNPESVDGKVFAGWTTQAITGVTDEAPEFVTEATMGESDVTFYAVFATSTGGSAAVTDELDSDYTGVTGNSYTSWTGAAATSGAVYAGQCAGQNSTIQLRSNNNNSGVISTTSGGKLSKVTVEWNSGTSSGRTLNVYGSNTAYSSASDLYNSNTFGKLLGTIVCGTSTELTVDGDYEYVGVRSASGALYLASLSITWGGGATLSGYCTTVAADLRQNPELSFSVTSVNAAIGEEFEAPTLNTAEGFNGTVEYESSDESVAQVMDNETGDLRLVGEGTATITATFTGNDDFKAGSASYMLTVADNRIATTTSYEDIELDLTEIGNLTRLAPVVKDANDEVVEYSYDEWPTEMSFEIVSDENGIIASLDNNTGEILLNANEGTATLKAYYNYFSVNNTYKPSECTFTITVIDTYAPGAKNNPYTVAQARDAIDAGTGTTGVYAKGIVSQIGTLSSGSLSYYISEDGTTADQLQAYRGKGLNGADFASANDIQVGDEVVIYGNLTKYNTTYEFAAGNKLVSRKTTPALAFGQESYEVVVEEELTITASSENSEGAITYTSSNTDVADIDANTGEVLAYAAGNTTITATIAATETYRSYSVDVLLTVNDGRTPVNITEITAEQTSIVVGNVTNAVVTNDQENWTAAYTFTSDNEEVAMVDETTGEILGVSKGTANITATLNVDPKDENYIEGNVNSMSFVITVVNPSHTAHFSFNGTIDNNNDVLVEEGEAIAFPSIEEIPDGYLLIGWAAEAVDGFVFEAPETIAKAVMGEADVTYYAVIAAGKLSQKTDELNKTFTGVSGTSYSGWENKEGTSGAVYAGNSAGGNESIQLRSSNNNSGIVSTTSGGRISKVTVSWNDGTAVGRKLDIYGSNEPYEAVTDVYGTETRGDLLGSIVCGTSTELTIVGDYAYVGVRSNSGAMYLNEIDFTWEQPEYDGYCSVTPTKVTLDETEGYTGTQDYAIVKLNRTVKANTWSSFTVPFDIPEEQIPGFITIKKLTSTSLNGEYVTLNFTDANSIEAGVPYMIRSTMAFSNIKVYGVDVDSELNNVETDYAVMKGNMTPMNVPVGAFFISNNTWYEAEAGENRAVGMKAFRAYIELTEKAQSAGARGFEMDIDGEVTRIDAISQSGNVQFNGTAYDLQGRRVEKPVRGLYIINGKKVMVK